jgi:SAM-dependent methyltransferase
MQAPSSHELIRDVNTRYHDVAAATYDAKWGIDFGQTGRTQVLGKVGKLVDPLPAGGLGRALEIGAGTGYFGLNLIQAGVIEALTCTDISAGMVEVLLHNADRLGLSEVSAIAAESESLPFADGSFDLVIGHAVLHHLPDLDRSFAEFLRVLAPGGLILFAGEPSRVGDRLARAPKRASIIAAPLWRRALRARLLPKAELGSEDLQECAGHALEHSQDAAREALEGVVDIHAFRPEDLVRVAGKAGFTDVTVRGEELLANWFGWFNRGLEATAVPQDIPHWWRQYAFRGYLWLQKLDAAALEPRLPPSIFYNLLLTGRRPTEETA